ncbi:unnamed protein product (macronuclear) [Paramecium tetraurelia]|uniref:Chromosome undetermined scaffold_1, whole genome shotgun sequence n=1 Tax=Paramecium tetraurelia TaxID=5888 RepID=Q6BFM7_PARTE|nr:Steroid dehydrogenase [Paramecium tetraurelia strain d4-2]XP_001423113.1 uncharacterized protein GSPATT00000150001 [Paramecium tetraurelia]CAH03543.1 Steroid dehydrogenase, putative [Paramecium tetraurelia]CAK55715.1 unnamed protein product [Paramecium tetraurelia]|eukprot:XP_001423113.1 hypothetical protein (macronuclear) [Paramecium tetraurelia strain d4-2]
MFFFIIGSATIAFIVFRILEEIYKCLQPFPNIQAKYGKDCWAVVTGASDGIGKGYCQVLAQQNVNICMLVRNEEKAKKLIEELSKGSTSKFKIVVVDFNNSLEEGFFDRVYKQIENLDIGLLINNVGVSHTRPLEKYNDNELREMITVNCFPIVFLTKKIIPKMLQRTKSAIINLSSFAGRVPLPYHQTYAATKAFDDFFSRSIALEYTNIDIMAHRPMYVTTAMTNFKKGQGAISPIQSAKGALQRLGLEYSTHGHILHRIQGFFGAVVVPSFLRNKLVKKELKKLVRKYL